MDYHDTSTCIKKNQSLNVHLENECIETSPICSEGWFQIMVMYKSWLESQLKLIKKHSTFTPKISEYILQTELVSLFQNNNKHNYNA